MSKISINESRRKDLDEIYNLGPKLHESISTSIINAQNVCFNIKDLTEFFADVAGEMVATKIALNFVSFRRYADNDEVSDNDLISYIRDSLQSSGWGDDRLETSNSFFSMLRTALSSELIRVATKSSYLFYQHAWHLHELSIITDLRPVFAPTRDSVKGMIVKNTLILTYSDGNEAEKKIEIAVGQDDLETIAKQAKSAISKSDILQNLVRESIKLPSKTYGSTHE